MKEKELIILLNNQSGYSNIDSISNRLGCSTSAARKLFKEINTLDNGCHILNKRNLGYYLEIHDATKFNAYSNKLLKDNSSIIYDHNYRMKLILFYLLQHSDGITIEALLDRIPVSKSTMLKDLDEVEESLAEYQLTLTRRKHYGLFVMGQETDFRRAYAKHVLKFQFPSNSLTEYIHVFNEEERIQVKQALLLYMKEYSLMLTDNILENIILHIEVLTMRTKKKKYIVDTYIDYSQVTTVYKEVANQISTYLETHFHIEIPSAEVLYLSAVISAKVAIGTSNLEESDLFMEIEEILKVLDKEFLTKFSCDEELLQTLTFHVYPLLKRLYYNMQLDNPMLEDINMEFANTISVSCRFSELIEASYQFKLSRDEIGFIALHFAAYFERQQAINLRKAKRVIVVCETGGGSAQLIKLKMESLFSDAIIITTSMNQMCETENELPDLYISTVPFEKTFHNVPVIHIKHFLNGEEIEKIKEVASLYLSQQNINPTYLQISSLFKKDLFNVSDEKDYLDIILKQAKKLVALGYGSEELPYSVLEREERFTTIYANGIAGPHPMNFKANENAIGVTILSTPIYYQDREIQIIFLINLKKTYLFLHKEISKLILKVIQDKTINQTIRNCHSYDKFINEIQRILK